MNNIPPAAPRPLPAPAADPVPVSAQAPAVVSTSAATPVLDTAQAPVDAPAPALAEAQAPAAAPALNTAPVAVDVPAPAPALAAAQAPAVALTPAEAPALDTALAPVDASAPALAAALAPAVAPVPAPATAAAQAAPIHQVQYVLAARRHMVDARLLLNANRVANAGQLFGIVAECGLKALVIACGVVPDAKGEIPRKHNFRQHIPVLKDRIVAGGHLIPDGLRAGKYIWNLAHLTKLGDWLIDHRYWSDAALPVGSVDGWRVAAEEILQALDTAKEDGVLI